MKRGRLTLLPAYIYHPELNEPHFYKTLDALNHATYVTLKPIAPWVLFFRKVLHQVVANEISNSPIMWQLRPIITFAIQEKGKWSEPLVLLDVIYLCLRLCNAEFKGADGVAMASKKLLFAARFNVYSDDLLNRWKWFHQLEHSSRPVKLDAFFTPWYAQIPLVYGIDGQANIDLGPSDNSMPVRSFVQEWLKIMIHSGWMSMTYCHATLAPPGRIEKGRAMDDPLVHPHGQHVDRGPKSIS